MGDIEKGWALFHDNILWILGSGDQIEFWNDIWMGRQTIRSLIQGPLKKGEENYRVSNFIVNRAWNFDNLSFHLPREVLNTIHMVHIPPEQGNDHPCSLLGSNGNLAQKLHMIYVLMSPGSVGMWGGCGSSLHFPKSDSLYGFHGLTAYLIRKLCVKEK